MHLLDQFRSFLLSQKNTPSKATVKNYAADVGQFLRWYELETKKEFKPETLTTQNIQVYKDFLAGTALSARSIERHESSLRKFFHFLKLEGLITQDPFEQLKEVAKPNQPQDPWHLRSFKNHLYVYNAADLTIKNYIIDVRQFLQWAEEVLLTKDAWEVKDKDVFDKLKPTLLEEYKERLLETAGFSPSSINRKLSSIRKYIAWAKEEGLIKKEIEEYPITHNLSLLLRVVGLSERAMPHQQHVDETIEQPEEKPYSKIPPIRLWQKTIGFGNALLDRLFVIPLILVIRTFQRMLWNMQGKPVFEKPHQEQKQRTVANFSKGFYAPLTLSTKYLPMRKKLWYTLRYKRPNWYKNYHKYAFVHYFHFAVLVIVSSITGYLLYNSLLILPASNNRTLAAALSPPRILSFQGRLTDNLDNPITNPKHIRFAIYNNATASGSALLWEEVDTVRPDKDGVFAALLGQQTQIPQSLFAENPSLWLGISIGQDPELIPRQQLATVGFATNAELLQGLPPITQVGAGVKNVVLALDSSGNLSIGGSANPTFQTTGGQFKLSGQPLVLATNPGSGKNVQIIPDGLGQIDLQKPLQNSTENGSLSTARGAVEVDDLFAILATSSGQSALTIEQNGAGPLISASSSGNAKFTVKHDGTTSIAGNLGLAEMNPVERLHVSGNATISGNITFHGARTLAARDFNQLSLGDSNTGNIVIAPGTGKQVRFFSSSNYFDSSGLVLGGNLTVSATTTFNTQTYTWPSSGQSSGYVLTTNGSGTLSWTAPSSVGTNYWDQTSGALYPKNATLDLFVGGTSSSSAKFAVLNINSGTPTASVSATSTGNGISLSGDGTIQSFRNNSLVLGGNTTGNILLDEQTDIGSLTTGVRITTAGALSDIDGTLSLNDAVDISGTLTLSGNTLTSSSDLSVNPAGGDLILSDAVTLNIGGSGSDLAYNVIGDSTSAASSSINSDDDLYIEGNLEVDGELIAPLTGVSGYWQRNSGALTPGNITDDLLLGATATTSAKFGFINVNSGTPTASISAGTTGALYIKADGTIATTAKQSLTLGDSTTTGNVIINPSGNVGIGTTAPTGGTLHVAGQCVTGDSLLITEDGKKIRVDEVKKGQRVYTLHQETRTFVGAQVNALLDMGVKPVFRLTTKNGKQIRTTGNHPYLVKDAASKPVAYESPIEGAGWVKVMDLQVGDNIATAAFHEVATDASLFGASRSFPKGHIHDNKSNNQQGSRNITQSKDLIQASHDSSNTFSAQTAAYHASIAVKRFLVNTNGSMLAKAAANQTTTKFEQTAENTLTWARETVNENPINTYSSTTSDAFQWPATLLHQDFEGQARSPAETDLVWDEIVSIVYTGQEQVWDLSIEGTHNFVANGIVAHNTYINTPSGSGTSLMVTNLGTGTSFRVNDETGDSDSTPFIIDTSGNVGIGTSSPSYTLHTVAATTGFDPVVFFRSSSSGNVLTLQGTGSTWIDLLRDSDGARLGRLLNGSIGATGNILQMWGASGVALGTTGGVMSLWATGTQVNLNQLGSAGTPSLTFTDDQNTGLFSSVADTLNFTTGGTERVRIDSSGRVGIGTTAPGFRLHVQDSQSATSSAMIENTNTGTDADGLIVKLGTTTMGTGCNTGGACNEYITFLNGNGLKMGKIHAASDTTLTYKTNGSDFAELFSKENPNETLAAGTLVCVSANGKVLRCDLGNHSLLGVISDHAGFVGGEDGPDKVVVGLLGQVSMSVSSENGPIEPGDFLTSSSTPGVAMKATRAGIVVGKAFEAFSCHPGGSGATDRIPSSSTRDSIASLQNDNSCQGKILVFVNVGWFDPSAYIASTGNLHFERKDTINSTTNLPEYALLDSYDKAVTSIGTFFEASVANLKAGYVHAQALTVAGAIKAQEIATHSLNISTANVTIAGQTLRDYIAQIVNDVLNVQSAIGNSEGLIMPIASIDLVKTDLITPLATHKVAVKLPDATDAKFEVQNSSGSALTSIDAAGNATFSGQLSANQLAISENLHAGEASIAGVLRARKIIADEFEGQSTATIASQHITNITNVYQSTSSGTQPGDQENSPNTLPRASLFADIASYSAQLAYTPTLSADFATFHQGLMAFGPASFADVTIANQLSVGASFIISDTAINVLGADLALQPLRQGGISLMGGLIYIDIDGNIRVKGNATFARDLSVGGVLAANILSPIPGSDLVIQLRGTTQSQTQHNADGVNQPIDQPESALVVKNASGSAVFSLNSLGDFVASGAATIAKLKLNPVSSVQALSEKEVIATGSAGTAAIRARQFEVTINNSLVGEESLIYITAVGTPSATPYLLRQVPGKSFTVGVQTPSLKDVLFNWLIVN